MAPAKKKREQKARLESEFHTRAAPNQAVEPTPNSLRSCLAPALGRGSPRALDATGRREKTSKTNNPKPTRTRQKPKRNPLKPSENHTDKTVEHQDAFRQRRYTPGHCGAPLPDPRRAPSREPPVAQRDSRTGGERVHAGGVGSGGRGPSRRRTEHMP
jgi:hypothetical protein